MRAYIAITGIVFALIVMAHIARWFEEGTSLLASPVYVAATAVSLGLAVWAAILLFRKPS